MDYTQQINTDRPLARNFSTNLDISPNDAVNHKPALAAPALNLYPFTASTRADDLQS